MSSTILQKILQRKQEEVAERKTIHSVEQLEDLIAPMEPCRGFLQALQRQVKTGQPAVIAEVKKASPSKGVIRADFDPEAIAKSYELARASCLSVLTDADFFQGCEQYLQAVRAAVSLPILRKDFVIDPWQVYESRAIGADCILLIVSALSPETLQTLNLLARQLSMDVLVEVHTFDELRVAQSINADLIGVNNRNLHDFSTSLQTSIDLKQQCDNSTLMVSESGISSRQDVRLLRDHDINTFLVGEHFMREQDPGAALAALFYN